MLTTRLRECVCVCVGYFKENILLHFIASMISGLITTAASMPVDIAKTRLDRAPIHLVFVKPAYLSGVIRSFFVGSSPH